MAYGDTTLDEIMRQLGASEGAPNRPQGRITQSSAFGLAPTGPATPAQQRFYNRPITVPEGVKAVGRRALGLGTRFLGPLGIAAGVVPAAEALKTGAEAAANAYAGAPGVQATVARGAAGFGAVTPAPAVVTAPTTVTAPAFVGPEPLASPGNMIVPPRGTGFIRNNVTGATTFLDARGQPVEAAPAAPANTGNFAGDFTGALLRLKQISGDRALKLAQEKAAFAGLAARGTAARGAAALQTSELSARLAAEHLRANPGDIAGAAAVLHGRSQGAGDNVFFPGIGPKDPTIVGSRRTGAVRKVVPTEPVQDITLAQAIASAKRNRTYKSDAQVRADIAKLPGYRLTD